MRKLNGSDVFAFARVIKAASLRDQLKTELLKISRDNADLESVGISGALTILEALADKGAESAFWVFLAGPMETTPKAVAELDLLQLIGAFKQIARENNLGSFFELVSGIHGQS